MMFDAPGIHVEQKKGSSERLNGRLIAYVRIDSGPAMREAGTPGYITGEMTSGEPASPLSSMVRNGILAVQANYVDQRNIRDFFRAEFGISLEKGIQEVIEQAKETGGLEGALDPEAVKERLESMKNADFIPIPAKVAFFNSEPEMLAQDADVFYLGVFTVITHAHLCVNSFPILYQAYFREQEHRGMEAEIAALLSVIEDPKGLASSADKENSNLKAQSFPGDLKEQLLKKLELLVAKVEALQKEDFEKLEEIRTDLEKLF